MENTIQFNILTKMLTAGKGTTFNINPFYGASKEDILNNFEYAEKIYKEVYEKFKFSYSIQKAYEKGYISETDMHTIIEEQDAIIKAIEDYAIPPLPPELEELKV